MLKNKVYIIEYEMISPIALGKDEFIESISSNKSAERVVDRVNTDGFPFKKAAEVKKDLSFLYENEKEVIKKASKIDRKLELLVAAYWKSKKRLEPIINLLKEEETGTILGIGSDALPLEFFEEEIKNYTLMGLNPVPELETYLNSNSSKVNLVNNPYDIHSLYLAEKFKAGAFQKSILTACVSSTQAIALGYESILNNEAKVVIAGGTDSLVNLVPLTSFGKLGVIPETVTGTECTPFDRNRNGTLAGEAAGFVILASEEFVNQNNIQPLGQIMGYGNSLDGYKITAPDPSGISMTKAIENALSNSGLKSSQIDYINAHGTGTRHNDELELRCIGKALGEDAKRIPISSTKDRHGHAIAAAGIQELCLLLELMKHETMPSNLKLKSPCSDEFNLLRKNKKKKITYALTNNFAFGGINTVLAVKNERI